MYLKERKHFITFVLVMLCFIISNNGEATINVSNFQHISTENGLSQKSVRKIFQDSNGFIWMGTQEGLNRYDGREFIHFRHSNNDFTSISSDVIRDIVEDSEQNIWIATSGGLNRFDIHSRKFERIIFKDRENKLVPRLNTLFKDADGKILIGSDGQGVFSFDPAVKPYKIEKFNLLPQIDKSDVRVIFKDSRDRYWVGTDGTGIWVKGGNKLSTAHFVHDEFVPTTISHNRIRSILEDQKGQIWIGSRGGGLDRFDELSQEFKHYRLQQDNKLSLSNNRVYKIFEDTNRNLWIGTDSGINLYQSETDDFKRIEYLASQKYGLSHNRVSEIFEDEGGIIWIGTLAGLNLWNPVTAKFVQYQHISENKNSLTNNTVISFAENNNNGIYVSTFGGGLNLIDTKSLNILPVTENQSTAFQLHDSRLTALLFDSQRRLWVGSATSGIRLFDEQLHTINTYSHSEEDDTTISSNGITDIYEDSDGEIWIATYGAGLNRYSNDSGFFKRYRAALKQPDSLSSDNVHQVFEDDEGYIWLATDGGGLSRLDKNTNQFIHFKHHSNKPESLSSDTAWSILQDSQGRFWIGTQGKGLNRWEPENRRREINQFQHYTIDNGLQSSTINGVKEDDDGYIWISTNKGVSRLDPESNSFKHYNLADQVHHNEFIQGSMLKAKDGRLYFGGINGISAFYPREIVDNRHIPKVLLTNIMSENKTLNFNTPLAQLKKVNFSHKDYLITFAFAALDYAQPERNQYQYKLEGFDPDWIEIKNLNRATYTNLPSGRYIFKVKGSNNDKIWSDDSINLVVIIDPAPWASWWAFVIYAALFCVVIIIIIRSQAKRIANQALFQKQVADTVESKTVLFEKENLSLKEQINNYQHSSGKDLATGLSNQEFFTEQLIISLAWLSELSKNEKTIELKLCCLFIKIKENIFANDKDLDDRLSRLATEISEREKQIHLVSRWNKNELAILAFTSTDNQLTEIIENITKDTPELSVGYSLTPLRKNDEQCFKWENILMLTEHAMRCAGMQDDLQIIGLLASNQKLSPALIKKVMTTDNILDMGDVFELEPAS